MTPLNKLVSILAPIMGKEVDDPEVLKVVVELMMAIREPSHEMMEAGANANVTDIRSVPLRRAWHAMIDALLTEGG